MKQQFEQAKKAYAVAAQGSDAGKIKARRHKDRVEEKYGAVLDQAHKLDRVINARSHAQNRANGIQKEQQLRRHQNNRPTKMTEKVRYQTLQRRAEIRQQLANGRRKNR